jgi:DNA-binding response OmpR family regulator
VRLLIVEDERRLGARLAQGLREDGFAVDLAHDLASARDLAIVGAHDMVLLDLNLPDGSGLDLLREWRDEGKIAPVLVLTSRDTLEDKVAGLDAGADDYLTKPFELAELLARVRALLRRRAVPPRSVLEAGALRLDRDARRATVRGEALPLTLKELALLEQFLLRPGVAVSRETLAEHVWDESYEARSNVIDVLVGRLRRKLDAAQAAARLRAVVGVGWALDASADPDREPS